ncbi:MAG: exosortase F system-associated membrane protein [Bacteroidia bacterium]
MQRKLLLSPLSWVIIGMAAVLLICVRMFQRGLFYDPFLSFFNEVNQDYLPQYDTAKLFANYLFRYALNTLLSLVILWVMFKDKAIIKLTLLLYIGLFIALAACLYIVLQSDSPSLKLLFYIRRFLIQPLPLLLFIPAFYYQKYMKP